MSENAVKIPMTLPWKMFGIKLGGCFQFGSPDWEKAEGQPESIGMCDESDDAAYIVRAANSYPAMLEALKELDASWTDVFPDGPDGSLEWAAGLGHMDEDTAALWRKVRAALALAEGRQP